MPKTNINDILKHGADTEVKFVDYSTPAAQKELKELKRKSEAILKNKYPNWHKLSKIFINS